MERMLDRTLILVEAIAIILFISLVGCHEKAADPKSDSKPLGKTKSNLNLIAVDSLLLIADSVLMVSHESTNYPKFDSVTGENNSPELLERSQPNWKIIKERYQLTKTDRLNLFNLLMAHSLQSDMERMSCFQPRNAIFLYNKGRLFYLDFCFDCYGMASSNDLSTEQIKFDFQKWKNLREYFLNKGLRYELE